SSVTLYFRAQAWRSASIEAQGPGSGLPSPSKSVRLSPVLSVLARAWIASNSLFCGALHLTTAGGSAGFFAAAFFGAPFLGAALRLAAALRTGLAFAFAFFAAMARPLAFGRRRRRRFREVSHA